MLGTDDRTLLVDLLSPPDDGFRLEHGVGTTFTLNLEALLRVPLAVVGAEWRDHADPLGVVHAVQSTVDRLDVFSQAGLVQVPASGAGILAFLEPMVHQVDRPSAGRLFHPKIWLLSFIDDSGNRRMRFLCGSRNLTNDRTWDAVIRLDGEVTRSRRAVNGPIGELVSSLPGRSVHPLPSERAAAIDALAELVRYVEWETPEGTLGDDWLTFHVFGRGKRKRPNMAGRRRLLISPFVSPGGLGIVWPGGGEGTVISRSESFAALDPPYRDDLVTTYDARLLVLDDSAALPDLDSDEAGRRWDLAGLHSKVYIVERDNRAHVFIGSANATENGWTGNDEVLVEVVGQRKAMGIDSVLGQRDSGLESVLVPFLDGSVSVPPDDELLRRLERLLIGLAELPYQADASVGPDAESWEELVRCTGQLPSLDDDLRLSVRLLSSQDVRTIAPSTGLSETWTELPVHDITPFVVISLTSGSLTVSTVVLAELSGAPDDRLDRLLARHVGSTDAFLRFLLLLLSADDQVLLPAAGESDTLGGAFGMFGIGGAGILEALATTLADRPEVLDDVERLVDQLSSTDAGRKVLPDGWGAVWSQITAARDALSGGGR